MMIFNDIFSRIQELSRSISILKDFQGPWKIQNIIHAAARLRSSSRPAARQQITRGLGAWDVTWWSWSGRCRWCRRGRTAASRASRAPRDTASNDCRPTRASENARRLVVPARAGRTSTDNPSRTARQTEGDVRKTRKSMSVFLASIINRLSMFWSLFGVVISALVTSTRPLYVEPS